MWERLSHIKHVIKEPRTAGKAFDQAIDDHKLQCGPHKRGSVFMAVCRGKVRRARLLHSLYAFVCVCVYVCVCLISGLHARRRMRTAFGAQGWDSRLRRVCVYVCVCVCVTHRHRRA